MEGNPIINANVELAKNLIGTATDDEGFFIFNDIAIKSDVLKVTTPALSILPSNTMLPLSENTDQTNASLALKETIEDVGFG